MLCVLFKILTTIVFDCLILQSKLEKNELTSTIVTYFLKYYNIQFKLIMYRK